MTLMDGGTVYDINVEGAIRRCKEIVEDESDIILDMVMCSFHFLDQVDASKYSTLDHLKRGREINLFYSGMNHYNSSVSNHPNVTFRYIISPSESIKANPLAILDFSQKEVDLCYKVGKQDAANAVKLGPGGYMRVMQQYAGRLRSGENVKLKDMIDEALRSTDSSHNFESS